MRGLSKHNMEMPLWVGALNFACLLLSAYAKTRVSMTVPVSPVKEQGMLSLKCQVFEADDTHTITISRNVRGRTEIVALGGHIQADIDDRFFLAVRRLAEGSVVHFLSIINVDREDDGEYFCNVLFVSEIGSMDLITQDSARIEISYFPADNYPVCTTSGSAIQGNTLLLNCTTEDSNPAVDVSWKRTGRSNKVLKTEQTRQDGFVYSELPLKLTMDDHQVVFICEISHPLFPGHVQTCHIGPLNVIANPLATPDTNYPLPTRTVRVHDTDVYISSGGTVKKLPDEKAESCKDHCSSYSSGISYWVIATIGTCGFAIFFLLIGIVLAVKLHRRMNAMPSSYHDDIYSEIHSRRDHNRVYMTLAKIDNPVNQANQPNWELEGNYTGTPIAVKP